MRRLLQILFLLILLRSRTQAHDAEADDEQEFTYQEGGEKGPGNWGRLKPEWEKCREGRYQSPININRRRVAVLPSLGGIERRYKPSPAFVLNRGHDIMVHWKGDAGGICINGTAYALQQCHWHTPSEHTIDHKRFEMEVHLVHTNAHGQIAVIGILYKLGRPDPFIAQALSNIKKCKENGTSLELGELSPWEIKFGSRKYFRYTGSLTVPPCAEGVVWSIQYKIRTVSKEQITAIREAVHDGFEKNSRPIQKLHGRTVYQYHPYYQ